MFNLYSEAVNNVCVLQRRNNEIVILIVRLLFGRVLSEIIEAGDSRHKKICFSGLIWSLKNNNKAKG